MRSQGTKKPTRSGVGLVLSESVRQVIDDDDIDPVGRSVGHTGGGHYFPAVAACLNVSRLGLSIITQQRFHVSSLGTPSRLGITHRGIDWLNIQSRTSTHLTG